MARFQIPRLLSPDERGMPPAVRITLLVAGALHLAGAYLLAFTSSIWLIVLPPPKVAVPWALVVGLFLLWMPRAWIASLAACYGLVGLGYLGTAAYFNYMGDRHGADLLIAAPGIPFLAMAWMLGYAWKRLRREP